MQKYLEHTKAQGQILKTSKQLFLKESSYYTGQENDIYSKGFNSEHSGQL
jgi:hypothetical protein